MSFRSKFCLIAGPIVALGAIAQGLDSDPAPMYNQTTAPVMTDVDPLSVTAITKDQVRVSNNTGKDIWQADFQLSYYSQDGSYGRVSDQVRVFDLRSGDSIITDVHFDFEVKEEIDYFSVVEERLTFIADDTGGERLRAIADKASGNPASLTLTECYALRGAAPESPCDALKDDGKGEGTTELQQALEMIHDGTAEYASEFSGK